MSTNGKMVLISEAWYNKESYCTALTTQPSGLWYITASAGYSNKVDKQLYIATGADVFENTEDSMKILTSKEFCDYTQALRMVNPFYNDDTCPKENCRKKQPIEQDQWQVFLEQKAMLNIMVNLYYHQQ